MDKQCLSSVSQPSSFSSTRSGDSRQSTSSCTDSSSCRNQPAEKTSPSEDCSFETQEHRERQKREERLPTDEMRTQSPTSSRVSDSTFLIWRHEYEMAREKTEKLCVEVNSLLALSVPNMMQLLVGHMNYICEKVMPIEERTRKLVDFVELGNYFEAHVREKEEAEIVPQEEYQFAYEEEYIRNKTKLDELKANREEHLTESEGEDFASYTSRLNHMLNLSKLKRDSYYWHLAANTMQKKADNLEACHSRLLITVWNTFMSQLDEVLLSTPREKFEDIDFENWQKIRKLFVKEATNSFPRKTNDKNDKVDPPVVSSQSSQKTAHETMNVSSQQVVQNQTAVQNLSPISQPLFLQHSSVTVKNSEICPRNVSFEEMAASWMKWQRKNLEMMRKKAAEVECAQPHQQTGSTPANCEAVREIFRPIPIRRSWPVREAGNKSPSEPNQMSLIDSFNAQQTRERTNPLKTTDLSRDRLNNPPEPDE